MNSNNLGFLLALLGFLVISCQQKSNYKEVRQEVISLHDTVMAKNSRLVGLQMKLDTLLTTQDSLNNNKKGLDTATEKQAIRKLLTGLEAAEESMNTWMHEFEPDVEGKSNEEAVKYFEEEKSKIQKVDSLYKKRIEETEQYLDKL